MADLGRWLQGDYRISDPADAAGRTAHSDADDDDASS